MAINPIDPSYIPETSSEIKKKMTSSGEKSAKVTNDKVELSSEAKRLHDVQVQSKLSDIRAKIEGGFYDSEEVLNSVAGSVVKVIRGK